jgi:large subunit ribosomal protein L17
MLKQRKLGMKTDHRMSVLKNLVTALLNNGKITTTEMRAKEVQKMAEKLITKAVRELDNFTSREVTKSHAKKDSKGNKILDTKTTKDGEKKYKVVEREIKKELVTVDSPSRLRARRIIINNVFRIKEHPGKRPMEKKLKQVNVVNKLFDEIAPKYKDRNGGYTRIYKIGQRKGDAAEMAILELV